MTRKPNMAKVKRGLGLDADDDVRAANLPMLRVLLVGGDPEQRSALALFISRALEPLVDRKACTSAFVDEPGGREAVEALEGFRVTIRDGGS
jgi:hypothetical protein